MTGPVDLVSCQAKHAHLSFGSVWHVVWLHRHVRTWPSRTDIHDFETVSRPLKKFGRIANGEDIR
jgi:proteasome lid subunit RPN8/RPN11